MHRNRTLLIHDIVFYSLLILLNSFFAGCSLLPIDIPTGQQPGGEEQSLDMSTLFHKAELLYESNRFEEAIRIWEQISPDSPHYLDAQLGIRNARLQLDKIAQEETDNSPVYDDELDSYIARAERLEYEGNIREALKLYEQARLRAPENILLHHKIEELHEILDDAFERHRALGELYMSRGEYAKARAEWEGLLELDASNALARQRLEDLKVLTATSDSIFVQRGRSLMRKGLLNQARAEFQNALKMNAGNENTRTLLRHLDSTPFTEYTVKSGDTLSSIAFNYTSNVADYSILKDFNQINDDTQLQIGQTLKIPHILGFHQALAPDEADVLTELMEREAQTKPDARELTRELRQDDADHTVQQLFEKGMKAYHDKNFREALRLFNQVYSLDQNKVEAYNYFLQSLIQLQGKRANVEKPVVAKNQGRQPPESGRSSLSEAEKLRASATAQYKAGNIKEAIRLLEKAELAEPNNRKIAQELEIARTALKELITTHLNEGIKLFNEDSLEEAIQEWDKVHELDPGNKQAIKYREKAEKRLNALKNTQ
ncbi:hypothetical protein CSA57_10955 [candidate division KSB3 bacterium]|nr:MAG: hypothetical protein CSA57_10955 [candidate division KSB3 bacterium]